MAEGLEVVDVAVEGFVFFPVISLDLAVGSWRRSSHSCTVTGPSATAESAGRVYVCGSLDSPSVRAPGSCRSL